MTGVAFCGCPNSKCLSATTVTASSCFPQDRSLDRLAKRLRKLIPVVAAKDSQRFHELRATISQALAPCRPLSRHRLPGTVPVHSCAKTAPSQPGRRTGFSGRTRTRSRWRLKAVDWGYSCIARGGKVAEHGMRLCMFDLSPEPCGSVHCGAGPHRPRTALVEVREGAPRGTEADLRGTASALPLSSVHSLTANGAAHGWLRAAGAALRTPLPSCCCPQHGRSQRLSGEPAPCGEYAALADHAPGNQGD